MIRLTILRSIYRRVPISSGLTKLTFNPIVNRLFKDIPARVEAQYRDGTKIEVDPRDHDGRILYLFGSNDLKVAASARALSRPGDVFLDIGANYASIGMSVASKVGADGSVHLFEPQQLLADAVEQSIQRSRHRNVHLHRIGLLDRAGSFAIRAPDGHSGKATFADHEGSRDFAVEQVCEVRAIGEYIPPLVAGKAFGGKIDIEGSENLVMPWLLAQPNLRFLIFEATHNQQELFDMIRAAKFALYGLNRRLFGHRLTRVERPSAMSNFHDLLALRVPEGVELPGRSSPASLATLVSYAL